MNNVGDGIKRTRGSWNFGGNIPENFKKHISKSVPLYNEGHNLICDLSDFYVKKNSIIYEIGCSTGSLISKLSNHNKSKTSAKFIGIDIEKDMINFAQKKLDKINNTNLSFVCDDILTFALEPSDMIISYYTMQFINPSIRQQIIDKIYNNLKSGGVLLLFEKVRGTCEKNFLDNEKNCFKKLSKSIVYKSNFKKGTKLTEEHITTKSSLQLGVSPLKYYDILGKTLKTDVDEDQLLSLEDCL